MDPTVKPVVLLTDTILDVLQRGRIVLDPLLGSGSTMVVIAAAPIHEHLAGLAQGLE